MKIDNSVKSVGSPAGGTTRARSGGAASATAGKAGVQVQLSPSAQLQAAESVIANTPTVNAERVAEIKQAIAEGRFKMDPERIADGLLENVRQMLAARQQP